MAKLKINDSVWSVLGEGLKIYFSNFFKFTQYMMFPVFGQIVGICLIFGLTAWLSFSIPILADKFIIFNNITVILIALLIVMVPGFVIFLKAFWDFMVAYGAINSMTEAILSTGKLYDFNSHNEVIAKRSFKYIGLLLFISVLTLIAFNPLFWIIALIFFVYFVLVFQVFTFEEETSIAGCFKKSLQLIVGNYGRTVLIIFILGLISHYVINMGVAFLFNLIRLSEILRGIFENWALTLPITEINGYLSAFRLNTITPLSIAEGILSSSILFVVTGLTLPMRSIVWTLWYKNLVGIKCEKNSKKKTDK